VLIGGTASTSRDGVFNEIIARGERTDGSSPVQYIVINDDPWSPTVWGGPFGKVPRVYSSPQITTADQAKRAGKALLARSAGAARSLSLSAVPNPALDAGDVIAVQFPNGVVEHHMVDRLTIPLGASDAMPVTTRSTKPIDEAP
jgi:hypothetical protein